MILFQWFWMSETNNILTCGWWKIQNDQVNDELQLNVPSRKVCAIKSRNWFIHLSDIGRIERTVHLDLKKFFLKAGSFLYSYVFLFSSRVNELDVDEVEDLSMEWMSYQKTALMWIIRKILWQRKKLVRWFLSVIKLMITIEITKTAMTDWGLVERYWHRYVDVGRSLKNKLRLRDAVGVIPLFSHRLAF